MSATVITKRVSEALQGGEHIVFFVGAGISIPPPSQVRDFRRLNIDTIKKLTGESLRSEDYEALGEIRPENMLQIGREELGQEVVQALEMLEGHRPNFNHFLLAEALDGR